MENRVTCTSIIVIIIEDLFVHSLPVLNFLYSLALYQENINSRVIKV